MHDVAPLRRTLRRRRLSIDANFNTRAVIWKNGKIKDLNTLTQNSPLFLLASCSINKKGEITGLGLTNGGDVHTYLAVLN